MKVTISNTKSKGWEVTERNGEERKRTYFKTRADAKGYASTLEAANQGERDAWANLDLGDRNAIAHTWARLKERGMDLLAILGAIEASPVAKAPRSAGAALAAFLEELRRRDRAPHYIKVTSAFGKSLIKGLELEPLSQINRDRIQAWLGRDQPNTWNTKRSRMRTFFRYALANDWISEDPMKAISCKTVVRDEVKVLTVDEHKLCLEYLQKKPRLLAWYVLSTICGLRPGEAAGAAWADVQMDSAKPHVLVRAGTSKKRMRRAVPLDPLAIGWLKEAKDLGAELPIAYQPRRRCTNQLRKLLGWPQWFQSVTRHTAATYRAAVSENDAATARSLGHSVAVLKSTYDAVVPVEKAQPFFAVQSPNTVAVDFTPATTTTENSRN